MGTLTDRPVVAGATMSNAYVLRPYRGPQDHPAMNRVANLVRAANGDPNASSVADMDSTYARYDQDGLLLDCVIAELDGELVAYARATWEAMAVGGSQVTSLMNIHPERTGQGLEALLAGHILARAESLIGERGATTESWVSAYVLEREVAQLAVFESLGFRRVRSNAWLVRPSLADIPDVPLPDGFEIRRIPAGDREMHRRVWDASARAFEGSWGEEVPTDQAYAAWLESPRFDPPLWRVAFHDDEVAGQILNFMDDPEPDGSRVGWTESISVQPEYRRRGLARALLAESLRAVRDAGATRAALGVDLQNPNQARDLYESLGFQIVSISYELMLGPFPAGSKPRLVAGAHR